jgi:hypothetical protein
MGLELPSAGASPKQQRERTTNTSDDKPNDDAFVAGRQPSIGPSAASSILYLDQTGSERSAVRCRCHWYVDHGPTTAAHSSSWSLGTAICSCCFVKPVFPLCYGMIYLRSAFDNVQVVGLEVTLPRSRPARYVSSIDPCCCFPAFDQLGLTSRPYLLAGCIYIDGT